MRYLRSIFFLLTFLVLIVFLSSCEKKHSLESLRQQLHEVKIALIQELQLVEGPEQFEIHEAKVFELFEDIAECMIQVRSLSKENMKDIVSNEDKSLSEALFIQCSRILSLPGGENWLLKCQARAVRLLDKEIEHKKLKQKI